MPLSCKTVSPKNIPRSQQSFRICITKWTFTNKIFFKRDLKIHENHWKGLTSRHSLHLFF